MGLDEWLAHRPDIYAPEWRTFTTDELVRAHIAWKVEYSRGLFDAPTASRFIQDALVRLYHMLGASDARLSRAVIETCQLALAHSDACRLAEEAEVHMPTADEDGMDVVFFPQSVVMVSIDAIPPAACRVMPMPIGRKDASTVEASVIQPHTALHITTADLRGRLGILVFRGPQKMITRVDEDVWVGFTNSSCILLVAATWRLLFDAAEDVSMTYGAHWVWVYCDMDTYRSGPREVREKGCSHVVIPKAGTVVVQRRMLRWTIGVAHTEFVAGRALGAGAN